MGGFAYAVAGPKVYVNLYTQGTARIPTKGGTIRLEQVTGYPWNGDVRIRVAAEKPLQLTLMLRVPGWALGRPLQGDLYRYTESVRREPEIRVNNTPVAAVMEKGYLAVEREWQNGDTVELSLPMPVNRVLAHDRVTANTGRVAVERGPLVYCAEWPDNNGRARDIVLDDSAALVPEPGVDMLGGITVITAEGALKNSPQGSRLAEKRKITLIPYYAWAHRGKGEMAVWLARGQIASNTSGISRNPKGTF